MLQLESAVFMLSHLKHHYYGTIFFLCESYLRPLNANCFTFTQQCEGGEWFHYTCVGLTPETRFKGKWFCPTCRNLQWGFSYVGKMHTSNNYFISKSLLQFMFLYGIVDFKTLYVVPFCTVFPIVHFKTLLVVPLVQSLLIAKKFPTIW